MLPTPSDASLGAASKAETGPSESRMYLMGLRYYGVQKCEFIVCTANAGSGILNVQLDGPSKATLDAYEVR